MLGNRAQLGKSRSERKKGRKKQGRAVIKLGFQNVRGLRNVGKQGEVLEWLKAEEVDLFGVSETHLKGDEKPETSGFYDYLGVNREDGDRKGGGVGIFVRKELGWEARKFSLEQDKDIGFYGMKKGNKWIMGVGIVYMSPMGSPECETVNTRKASALVKAVEKARKEGVREVVLVGDFNGHIRELDGEENGNGKIMKDLALALQLRVGNLECENMGGKTWRRGQSSYVLDYALWNDCFGDRVSNGVIKEEGYGVESDHRYVEIQLRLGKVKMGDMGRAERHLVRLGGWKRKSGDWARFRERVEEECELGGEKTLTEIMVGAAADTVGRTKRNRVGSKHKQWFSAEAKEAVQKRREACRQYNREKRKAGPMTEEVLRLEQRYHEERERARMVIRENRRLYETKELADMGTGTQRTKNLWEHLRKLTRGCQADELLECIGEDGEVLWDVGCIKEEVERVWRPILGGLVHTEKGTGPGSKKVKGTLSGEIYEKELEKALRKVKSGKAEGPDQVIGEFLRELGPQGKRKLLGELNLVLKGEREVPEVWKQARVRLIWKRGDRRCVANYRPIAITSVVYKLFSTILQSRLSEILESADFFGDIQTGFRRDRRVEDNLFILGRLREVAEIEGRDVVLCFLDLQKAYDRVSREKLWEKMRDYGFGEEDVNLLSKLYEGGKVKVEWGAVSTEWIDTKGGVRQGCPRAPTEFNIYLQELGDRVDELGIGFRCGRVTVSVLMYADDVVLVAENSRDMKAMLREVDRVAQEYGLAFSMDKSKVLRWGKSEVTEDWSLGGGSIEQVKNVKYLGVWVNGEGAGRIGDYDLRMKEVGRTVGMLKYAGGRSGAREWLLREGWKGVGVPRCMYGGAVLAWGDKEIRGMEAVQKDLGRWIWKVGKWAPNAWIRGECGWSSMEEREAKAKLKYLARVATFQGSDLRAAVLHHLLQHQGKSPWVARVKKLARKYGCSEWVCLIEAREVDEGGMREWGMDDKSRQQWEREIERKVRQRGCELWRKSMRDGGILDELGYRENKRQPRWEGGEGMSLGESIRARARGGLVDVRGNKYRERQGMEGECQMCGVGSTESLLHWLVECPHIGYRKERDTFVEKGGSIEGIKEEIMKEDCSQLVKGFLAAMWGVRARVRGAAGLGGAVCAGPGGRTR